MPAADNPAQPRPRTRRKAESKGGSGLFPRFAALSATNLGKRLRALRRARGRGTVADFQVRAYDFECMTGGNACNRHQLAHPCKHCREPAMKCRAFTAANPLAGKETRNAHNRYRGGVRHGPTTFGSASRRPQCLNRQINLKRAQCGTFDKTANHLELEVIAGAPSSGPLGRTPFSAKEPTSVTAATQQGLASHAAGPTTSGREGAPPPRAPPSLLADK